MQSPIEYKIKQALTSLILNQPFFGALALRLRLQSDPGCQTTWTDGISLGYDPVFVEKLQPHELRTVIAHAVLHVAHGHPWRRDARDSKLWNVAADHSVNLILQDAGFPFPAGMEVLKDPKYRGQSAEAIYSQLPKPQPGMGEVRDPKPEDHPQNLEAEWQCAVLQAAQAAKAMGKLPAGIDRLVRQIKEPRVDWKAVLRRFIQETAKSDYSWKMPNTRYLASGLYLPALRSENCPPIAIGVDTSGSISQDVLGVFSAEINDIMSEVKPESVTVIYCDAKVHRVETFERDEPIVMNPQGGGGTAFEPVFSEIEKLGLEPECLVYLTDLMGSWGSYRPSYPVLWATIGNAAEYGNRFQPPYGEVIKIDQSL